MKIDICLFARWLSFLWVLFSTQALAQLPGPYNPTACAADRFYGSTSSGTLNCTAGDIGVTSIVARSPLNCTSDIDGNAVCTQGTGGAASPTCTAGKYVTFPVDVTVEFSVAQARYDVGVFFSTDGNDQVNKTSGNGGPGSCSVGILPTSSPFLSSVASGGNGNSCGDGNSSINGGTGRGTFTMNIKVPCQVASTSGNNLSVPWLASWANNASQLSSCSSNANVVPGTTAKCFAGTGSAGSVNIAVIVVPSITKVVNKTATFVGDTISYTVTLKNTSGKSLDNISFTDPQPNYLTFNSVSCSGATCPNPALVTVNNLVSATGIPLPSLPNGGTLAFTVNATVVDYPGNRIAAQTSLTNTANVMATVNGTAYAGPAPASVTIPILAPPTVAKSFSPSTIAANGGSTLTITLTNPNNAAPILAKFSDTYTDYTTGLKNTTTPNPTNTCGGAPTASAGGSSISQSGINIPSGGNCTITVNVTGTALAGTAVLDNTAYANLDWAEAKSQASSGSAQLSVAAISAANSTVVASPTTVLADGTTTSTITVTLRDGAGNPVSGKTVTLTAGSGSSVISSASGPSNASGVVTFTVKDATVEAVTYTATDVTDSIAITQTATVNFVKALTVTKSFTQNIIAAGEISTLTIKLTNENSVPITGVGFTDNYPQNLINKVSLPDGATANCTANATSSTTGSMTAVADESSLSLAGATIPANGSCTVTTTVTSIVAGTYQNTVTVSTADAGNQATSTATLTVTSGAPAKLSFHQQPTDTVAGMTITPAVTVWVLDAFGNQVGAATNTVSLSISGGATLNGTTSAAAVGGIATFANLSVNTTGSYTLTATSPGLNSAISATFNIIVSTFNAFETSLPSTAIAGPIYTKLVGTQFSLDVAAVGTTPVAFSGNVYVQLVANNGTPGDPASYGTNRCPTDFSIIPVTVGQIDISPGRKKVQFPAVPNAYRDVRVRIGFPAASPTMWFCSTDSFAIRPKQFSLSSSPSGTSTALLAGTQATGAQSLTLTADSGAGAGYTGIPVVDTSLVGDWQTPTSVAIPPGSLTGSFAAANGVAATGAFYYSDFGNIIFTTNAVRDSSFTGVDKVTGTVNGVNHGAAEDCIVGSTSNSLTDDRYGCDIGSAELGPVGRFRVHHYEVAASFGSYCGGFTYMGQPNLGVTLTLSAHNSEGGQMVRLLSGAPNRPNFTIAGDNNGTAIALNASTFVLPGYAWPDTAPGGIYSVSGTYTFNRPATPIGNVLAGPFENFRLKVSVVDADGAQITKLDGTDIAGVATVKTAASTKLRYGRLWLTNAYGNEFLALPVPIQAQYWLPTGWQLNREDSCTKLVLPTSGSGLTTTLSTTASMGGSTTSPATLAGGNARFVLSRPGVPGVVDIASAVLLSNGTTATWLPPSTATVRACFGRCGPRSSVIYIRERF